MPQVMGEQEAEPTEVWVGIQGRALGRETTRDHGSSLPLLLKAVQVLP